GRAHIITAPGPGGGTTVRVWRFDPSPGLVTGTVTLVASFPTYDVSPGGVAVACGPLDGPNLPPSIITGPGPGAPALVKVFPVNLATGTATERTRFMAYPDGFRGGVSVAAGDVRHRGRASIITGPTGAGVPPIVGVWTLSAGGAPPTEEISFQPYDEHAPGGLAVGAGDVTGLNGTNLITSPGPGTQPRLVKVFNAEAATVL